MKKILLIIFVLSIKVWSASEYEPPKRSATLSTAYAERVFNSNEGLADFPLTVIDGYSALFDKVTGSFNGHWGRRLATAIGELPLSYWLAGSLFIPYHEFGHARGDKALGWDYHYSSVFYGKDITRIPNYWTLSAIRLISPPHLFPGFGGASSSRILGPTVNNIVLNRHWGTRGTNIIISAGGLNNQSYLAKKIAARLYFAEGHFLQLGHYLGNKFAGAAYVIGTRGPPETRSDVGAVSSLYRQKSLNIGFDDFQFQSTLSLLSGTTFAFLRGYYHYVANGDAKVLPAEIYGVRIPDLNSYINAKGLSFEIVSGYRCSKNLYFDLAYEFIWKGDRMHEVTPSVHYNLSTLWPKVNSLWAHFDLIVSKGIASNLNIEWMPFEQFSPTFWQRFSYFAEAHLYNGLTLYGERNITKISPTSVFGFSAFLGLRFNY